MSDQKLKIAPAKRELPGAWTGGVSSVSFPEYKRCSGCGEVKPLDQFYRCAPLDVEWLCVSCHKSLHATEQANGPQKLGDLVQLESGEEAA